MQARLYVVTSCGKDKIKISFIKKFMTLELMVIGSFLDIDFCYVTA